MTAPPQIHKGHPQTRITNHRMHQHRQTGSATKFTQRRFWPGIITAQIQAQNHYSTDSGPESLSLQHRFRPRITTAQIQAQNHYHYSIDSGPESLSLQHRFRPRIIAAQIQAQNHYSIDSTKQQRTLLSIKWNTVNKHTKSTLTGYFCQNVCPNMNIIYI